MDLYINSAGIISAAGHNAAGALEVVAPDYDTDKLIAAEPPYNIPPMQLRRMSKVVRMGIGASHIAMQQAGIEKPDAIITGTSMGCMNDTEHFLGKMVTQDEQMLTPTSFIQSTHNTVAGQVALLTGCNGHNYTYVHRGHSFEHAIVDTQLYLKQHPGSTVLAGGVEELTKVTIITLQQNKVYRKGKSTADSILHGNENGSIAGEGAAFFVVTDKPLSAHHLHIKGLDTFTTHNQDKALERVQSFIRSEGINTEDIDLVMLGLGGDEKESHFYSLLQNDIFKNNSCAAFKHLSGEYGTAGSFALGLLMEITQTGKVPPPELLNKPPEQLHRVLLVNSYMHYYSIWDIELV